MSCWRAAPACSTSRVQSIDTIPKRDGCPDDLLDHHSIVVFLAVGQLIIGNEGRMGLDLVVAGRAVSPAILDALSCPYVMDIGRELFDQPALCIVQHDI